ncbi:MAG: CPBP family intramembrane metalloprotease [Leptolinea sp.]|jgi:membrane protease YdiL (CAAX protease family)|nr:CPBP family intramembrane metalloprotease [Leptolinea sp.]
MKNLKPFAFRHPIFFALVIMGIAVPLTEIPLESLFSQSLSFQKASYISGILLQGGTSLLLALLITRLGMREEAGFTPISRWKSVWLIWPLIAYSLLNGSDLLTGAIRIDWSDGSLIILYLLLYLSVGFVEEILFRGLMLSLMLRAWGKTRRGILAAVVLSSVVFGVVHVVNLLMGRRDLLTTGTQILYALFFGVFFAACFLRSRSIWPVIFGHFLFDLCGSFQDLSAGHVFTRVQPAISLDAALVTLGILLPLFLIGLFYLRKVEPVEKDRTDNVESLTTRWQCRQGIQSEKGTLLR